VGPQFLANLSSADSVLPQQTSDDSFNTAGVYVLLHVRDTGQWRTLWSLGVVLRLGWDLFSSTVSSGPPSRISLTDISVIGWDTHGVPKSRQ